MEALRTIVIGAGQAGLSAAYWLARRGLAPWSEILVLANPGPGGAWRHRWDSLTFDAAHGLHPLPGLPLEAPDPREPASAVVRRYYGKYEAELGIPVIRPVHVASVSHTDDGGHLLVRAADGREWLSDTVISATGTWDRPHWPHYPGRELFRGRQLHTHDFVSAEEFRGQRVLVVGGGTSALQFLLQLDAAGAETAWSTRRAPDFTQAPFDADWGVAVERRVGERTRAGLPPLSVVGATGLPLTEQYRAGIDAGILVSRGPLDRITPTGAVLADGTELELDAILWATGFRASLGHLAPLRLREPGGGVLMADDGVSAVREPRLFLVGYGASASTVGATRAGRAAAVAATRALAGAGERVREAAVPSVR